MTTILRLYTDAYRGLPREVWMLSAVLLINRSGSTVVILTLGEMLIIPAAGGWVANRSGAVHRGKYMGLYTMAWGLGFIVGPAAGAWIYQNAGADRLWVLVGVLGGLLWLGAEALGRVTERRRQPDSSLSAVVH